MRCINKALFWAVVLLTMVVGSFTLNPSDALAANAEVELLELEVAGLKEDVAGLRAGLRTVRAQLEEADTPQDVKAVDEVDADAKTLEDRVLDLETLVNAEEGGIVWLRDELKKLQDEFKILSDKVTDLEKRIERLEAAEAKDRESYFSLAAGVAFTGSVRRDVDTVGVRELPTRSMGIGPSAMVCYESLNSAGIGWGYCADGSLSAYGYKGILAQGGGTVMRVFGPRFAVGGNVSVLNETHGVYDSMPYLYGSSTGLSGSGLVRLTPVIPEDGDAVWDMVLGIGIGQQRDLTQGHIEIPSVNPAWFRLTIQRRKVVEGGFPANVE